MKKTMILLFVCAASMHIIAQKTKVQKAETPTQSALLVSDVAPPPPPPPPPPPVTPLPPEPPVLAVPAIPPAPPAPPAPPVKKES